MGGCGSAQFAASAGIDQAFAPIDNSALCFQFKTAVASLVEGDGLLQASSGMEPADQNHEVTESQSENLKSLLTSLCSGLGLWFGFAQELFTDSGFSFAIGAVGRKDAHGAPPKGEAIYTKVSLQSAILRYIA
tara:strand:+ start:663 stop:1061 length:399 start_codon:yes stop_codon:yes gene_type:complete